MVEEPIVFVNCSEVEAMLKKEKGKASSTSLDLKPPYSTAVAVNPYTSEYEVLKF